MLKASALQEYVLTCHTLRNLTCREFLSYVDAQCHEHGADVSADARSREKIHTLTKGNISKLNELAHLSMLAAGPNGRQTLDRVICVSPPVKRCQRLSVVKRWPPSGCSRPSCSPPAAG